MLARRTCLHGLEEVLLAVVNGEHEDAHCGPSAKQLGGRLKPGQSRHRHVEDCEIDFARERLLDRLVAVGGLRDDLDVRLTLEHGPQPAPNDRVVVRQQHPCLQRDHDRS
jgi:hypothetical protein